jgi:SAM-dependent methyltransferase
VVHDKRESTSRCGAGLREDWNRRYAEREFLWTAEPNRFLVAEAADLAPGRALDLGCGEGRNAVWLAERGWQVTAVDFSDVGLMTARRLAASRGVAVDWVLADLLDYRPASAAYDLVVIFYLQLPAERRRLVLGRAAAAVAPGGTMLVVGHDVVNLSEGHGGPRNAAVLFTPEDVVREVEGLEIERADRVRRPVALEDEDVEAIDALVRARKPVSAS